ncbi:MAG: zinc ABC transporter substrate-binding protein [Candidatus Thiodiazotropha sp. (ex Lucinoma borealis)]|nr:zinc ABC transporter substrate-binding protein [Candidatus Thiodiazotropha sp. (ex Lucinoma borealis)]MCU7855214.1 zinc ABC transporter substrate-binding protein [Candidatus Thiodiazotropha sp. (ex Lucinoma borealis)]MCU7867062.1 zinc ABC transporter substrate-binding protein [Candidatus Thiodiazotropha sp. (ex Lucinoma borealis)]
MTKEKQFLLHWLLLLVPCLFSTQIHAEPKVVVSIKPVHSLVAGLMRNIGEPKLLIDGNQSPHSLSLRPSNARALNEADLIIWIGSGLEPSLSHILEQHKGDTEVISLLDTPGLHLLPIRVSHEWELHRHISSRHQDDGLPESDRKNWDNHIWLSPENASLMVQHLTLALIRLDASHSDQYLINSQHLLNRLQRLDTDLTTMTTAVREIPYMVFHDAYHYLEYHFQLNAVGSVSISPERLSGARRIHQLRKKIRRLNARCVFSEPQFEPKLVHTLVEGTQAHIGQLDPLGNDLPTGPDAYFMLMQHLSNNLIECLASRSRQ